MQADTPDFPAKKQEITGAQFRRMTRPLCLKCGRKHYGACLGAPLPGYPRKEPPPVTFTDVTGVTHNAVTAKCVECDVEFEPKRADAKFCGAACKQKAHRRKLSGWDPDPDEESRRAMDETARVFGPAIERLAEK